MLAHRVEAAPPAVETARVTADEPVVKSKDAYTRGRWQTDAHGFWRSSGNRLLVPSDFDGLDAAQVFQTFKRWSQESVYDYEANVALCDALAAKGMLPPGFMLLQPQSHSEDVWTDVARMRTLNTLQAAQDRVQHLCPMQFDIADRLITRFSMPVEEVADPFSGLGTVAHQAVKLGRRGYGTELAPVYFDESVRYLRALERRRSVRTLFDLDAAMTASTEETVADPVETPKPAVVSTPKRTRTKKTDAAAMERDGAKRKAMYEEIQADFRKSSPFVMLFQQTEVAALRSNVEGLRLGSTSDSTYMFKVSKK